MRKIIIALLIAGCGESEVIPPTPIPTTPPIPTATATPVNPDCIREMSTADGPGGFLWKPESEHDGTVVVILPPEYTVPFDSVEVTRQRGAIEQLRYTGKANGGRQHWRGDLPGRRYRDNSLVVARENSGNVCEWRIKTAAQRND